MLIVIPFASFLLILALLSQISTTKKLLFRERILLTSLVWGLALTFITEVLSLFYVFNVFWVAIAWLLFSITLLFFLIKLRPKVRLSIRPAKSIDLPLSLKLSILGVLFIVLISGFQALFSAPNNGDAMTYHLARVMHWIQNQSVAYYPTHVTWQIYLAPWAGFAQANFRLLSGSDYLANIIQWFSMIGSLIGVSLIARSLKASKSAQIISSVIAATIPMGILQSASSQDDYVLAFWLVCFVYFGFVSTIKNNFVYLIASFASLGLVYLTKQTAYLYSLPFLIWFGILWINKFGWKKALVNSFLLIVIVFIINLGFFLRNYTFVGVPVFSLRDYYINKPVGFESLISGTIKNASLHISTPFPSINQELYRSIVSLHKLLNIDINKPGLNWLTDKFGIPPFLASEYFVSNTAHFILILVTSLFLFGSRLRKDSNLLNYIICLVFGFILFSFILRWQPSSSRLHLPLFVLWAPAIAIILNKAFKSWITNAIITFLILTSFYFVLLNRSKPITPARLFFTVPREEQYFIIKPFLYDSYKEIRNFVNKGGYQNIGLVMEERTSDYEYALLVMLTSKNKKAKIFHVEVQNRTKRLSKNLKPDVVVYLGGDREVLKKYTNSKIPVIGLK